VTIAALRAPGNRRPNEPAAPSTDQQLVERCHAGSEAAFAEIVTRHEAALRRHCARILGHSGADDAVQEAFVAAWMALRANAAVTELRPWLFVIARRKALTLKKRSRYTSELTDAVPGAQSCAQDAALAARARETLAALTTLPAAQREALVGSALHGRSGAQLAHQLGVTEPTVRQLVFRARERVRLAVPACVAPPLALLRLIRRATAMASRAVTTPGSLAAGITVKAGVVLVVAAAAVGAGETLQSSGPAVRAPARPAQASARATTARPPASPAGAGIRTSPARVGLVSSAVAPAGTHSPAPPLSVQRRSATARATLPSAATPVTSAAAVASVGAQAAHVGRAAATATATAPSIQPTLASAGAPVRAADGVLAQTVGPLVNPLIGSARHALSTGTGELAATAAQAGDSAGQGVTGTVPAVASATTEVAQEVGTAGQTPNAIVPAAQTVVTTVAAPVTSGLGGVVPSLGPTGASGPLGVPHIG
jgi:RNA polymerase sigma-70 factor (ECF subfamily)